MTACAVVRYRQLLKLLETDVEVQSLSDSAKWIVHVNLLKTWDEMTPEEQESMQTYSGAGIETPEVVR